MWVNNRSHRVTLPTQFRVHTTPTCCGTMHMHAQHMLRIPNRAIKISQRLLSNHMVYTVYTCTTNIITVTLYLSQDLQYNYQMLHVILEASAQHMLRYTAISIWQVSRLYSATTIPRAMLSLHSSLYIILTALHVVNK